MSTDHLCGDNFERICDWTYSPGDAIQPGVAFVKTDYVRPFFDAALRDATMCIIVTHNSDICVTDALLSMMPANVAHWFGANVLVRSPQVTAIPLGMANPRWPHGDWGVVAAARKDDTHMLRGSMLARFGLWSNRPEREACAAWCESVGATMQVYKSNKERPDFAEYCREIRRHIAVACPAGNGPDTHRVWEALYLGAVPIIGPGSARALLPIAEMHGIGMVVMRQWLGGTIPLTCPARSIDALRIPYWRNLIRLKAAEHGL